MCPQPADNAKPQHGWTETKEVGNAKSPVSAVWCNSNSDLRYLEDSVFGIWSWLKNHRNLQNHHTGRTEKPPLKNFESENVRPRPV